MSTDLAIPFVPENVMLPRSTTRRMKVVTSDVYNICDRIKQIDRRLMVVLQENHPEPWAVMENCADGNVRMVARYEALDARILDDLQRMLAIPYLERFRILSEKIDKENADNEKINMDTEANEKLAFEFRRALRDSNIEPAVRFTSTRPIKRSAIRG